MLHTKLIHPFGALISSDEIKTKNVKDICIAKLTELVFKHKILVLRGFDLIPDIDYIRFCESFGKIMLWDFGAILNVKMEHDPKNHIFSKGRVELHWDGAFTLETPKINIFQCIASSDNSAGGETLFVDTTKVINDTNDIILNQWSQVKLRYSTEKKAHYGGSIEVNFIEKHPHQGHDIIRFIEIDNEDNLGVNPITSSTDGLNGAYRNDEEFFKEITDILYNPKYMYRHNWSTGDYMLVDNNSVLHGRAKIKGNIKRHLKRVHVL